MNTLLARRTLAAVPLAASAHPLQFLRHGGGPVRAVDFIAEQFAAATKCGAP